MDNLVGYAIKWWIKDEKWLYSKKEGRDVGVPETVDVMLGIKRFGGITPRIHGFKPEYRNYLIEGYFLCKDIADFDGVNQLEGELKRFEAGRKSLLPGQVKVTREIVEDYCKKNNLEESVQKFLVKLNYY